MLNNMLNKKNNKIMGKKTNINGEQQKPLYEWAEEQLFADDVSQFLGFCKLDMYEPTDVVPYHEFLVLKEKFEA
jgi:hypothetical protein